MVQQDTATIGEESPERIISESLQTTVEKAKQVY
jgi:hypothetical protein